MKMLAGGPPVPPGKAGPFGADQGHPGAAEDREALTVTGGKKGRKKEFQHDPFKRLKGFCVSSPEKTPPADRPVKPTLAASSVPDEATLFADEMDRLGVARHPAEDAAAEKAETGSQDSSPKVAVEPPTDRELFLASLGEMEAVFCDEIPAEDGPARPAPCALRRTCPSVADFRLASARERVRHLTMRSTKGAKPSLSSPAVARVPGGNRSCGPRSSAT
jgi:hypothetical protein